MGGPLQSERVAHMLRKAWPTSLGIRIWRDRLEEGVGVIPRDPHVRPQLQQGRSRVAQSYRAV